jgi:hypothetical protein
VLGEANFVRAHEAVGWFFESFDAHLKASGTDNREIARRSTTGKRRPDRLERI